MDFSDVLFDPEMGYTSFSVERVVYTRGRGGTSSRSETFSASGLIHPGTPEMLQLLPEEERKEEFIAVYTDFALSTGDPGSGASFTGADMIRDKAVAEMFKKPDPSFIAETEELINEMNNPDVAEGIRQCKMIVKSSASWSELAYYYVALEHVWNIKDNGNFRPD